MFRYLHRRGRPPRSFSCRQVGLCFQCPSWLDGLIAQSHTHTLAHFHLLSWLDGLLQSHTHTLAHFTFSQHCFGAIATKQVSPAATSIEPRTLARRRNTATVKFKAAGPDTLDGITTTVRVDRHLPRRGPRAWMTAGLNAAVGMDAPRSVGSATGWLAHRAVAAVGTPTHRQQHRRKKHGVRKGGGESPACLQWAISETPALRRPFRERKAGRGRLIRRSGWHHESPLDA